MGAFFACWGLVFGFSILVRIWLESNSDTSESRFCLIALSWQRQSEFSIFSTQLTGVSNEC